MTSNFLPPNHLPCTFALISYSHRPLVLLETSPVDRDPRSILHGDILTRLTVPRRSTKIFPPLSIQMREPVERAGVRINAQISTISPQLHVCQALCCGEITLRSPVFHQPAKAAGRPVKIDHYIGLGGRNLGAPPLAYKLLASAGMNQMVATAPRAVSFAWQALCIEQQNLSRCHN